MLLTGIHRSDLQPDQYGSLRQQLFEVILKFSNGPKLVLTRLCVAMVIYIFNAVPEVWPNAIVSLVQSLSTPVSMGAVRVWHFILLIT